MTPMHSEKFNPIQLKCNFQLNSVLVVEGGECTIHHVRREGNCPGGCLGKYAWGICLGGMFRFRITYSLLHFRVDFNAGLYLPKVKIIVSGGRQWKPRFAFHIAQCCHLWN